MVGQPIQFEINKSNGTLHRAELKDYWWNMI